MGYTARQIPSPCAAGRVRERGAWEIRDRFQAMFSRLSPLPGPLPARSSRGEGEDEAPPTPRALVAYPADSLVRARRSRLRRAAEAQEAKIKFALQPFVRGGQIFNAGTGKGGGNLLLLGGGEQLVQLDAFPAFNRRGQVAIDGARGQPAVAGDSLHAFTGAKAFERFAGGVIEACARRRRRREGIVGKYLARVGAQMAGDLGEEDRAKLLQLPPADAADTRELVFVRRVMAGHLPQGHVGKDDVGRHIPFVGQPLAQLAKAFEERLVAGDFPGVVGDERERGDRLGEDDRQALLQDVQALRREFEHTGALSGLEEAALADQLAADRLPFGTAVFGADAVGGKLVVPPFADFFGVRAGEHFDDVIETEVEAGVLADAIDAGEKFVRGERAVVRGAGREAVVAAGAIGFGEGLAEIVEQRGAAAFGAFRVLGDLLQLFAGDLLFLEIGLFVDELGVFHDIARAEQQEAFAGQAIAARAASFLIIAFDVFGQIVVDDEADVRLVDPHAEGDGRADHAHVVAQKQFLVFGTLPRGESGVVRPGRHALLDQSLGHALGALAALAIDDAAFPGPGADEFEHLLVRSEEHTS